MSDELKPCPHCGNGSLLVIARRASIYPLPDVKVFEGRVLCEECGGAMLLRHMTRSDTPDDIGIGEVRDALRERWNARAAVTDEQFATAVHDGRVWQVVRECENLLDHSPCDFECSECGFSVRTVPDGQADWQTPFWRHCPNCGAKVAG